MSYVGTTKLSETTQSRGATLCTCHLITLIERSENFRRLGTLMFRRKVTAEQIDHLPSDLHRMVARILIDRGEWIVVRTNIWRLHSGERMSVSIPACRGGLFRGGGSYKKSIFESLLETFGSDRFTFRQASAKIEGFNRSTCRDFVAAGLIKYVARTDTYYYRVHQPIPTHKLTCKELWMKRKGVNGGSND